MRYTKKQKRMYIQEITLDITPDLDADLMIDEFNWLMSNYHKNGQILSGAQTQFLSGNKIVCLPYTLEKDSLDAKFNNSHVNKQIKRLRDLCNADLKIRVLGTDYNSNNETCSCTSHSTFLLSALSFTRDSAVMCGDCRLSLPLYRLPKTDDDNYTSILNWQLSTMICDGFEIINLNTKKIPSLPENILLALDKQGYALCEKLEHLTGVKTRLLHKLAQDKKSKSIEGKELAN
jgi:predicted  nucleic acid-binding Zn ribbon protein